jgi:predicted esterase
MLSALVLAAAYATVPAAVATPAPAAAAPVPAAVTAVPAATTPAPATPAGAALAMRIADLRRRYDVLWEVVNRPRIIDAGVRERLRERVAVAAQTALALADEPDAAIVGDLERRADLDERTVPALVSGTPPPLDAAPGGHVGIVHAGGHDEPFAYWVPRGYDPRKPAPLVVLVHGATQPETDLVARSFFRDLADASGAVLLAPGGEDRDPEAMLRSLDAAEHALAAAVPTDPRRRYAGGFSNGVFCAYHAVAVQGQPYAGFLGIAGFVLREDVHAVGLRLYGEGAYIVIGADDRVIGVPAVRSNVRALRTAHVYARYYEVPGAPHALRPLYPAIAKAWNDMLSGNTKIDNDGLGGVNG